MIVQGKSTPNRIWNTTRYRITKYGSFSLSVVALGCAPTPGMTRSTNPAILAPVSYPPANVISLPSPVSSADETVKAEAELKVLVLRQFQTACLAGASEPGAKESGIDLRSRCLFPNPNTDVVFRSAADRIEHGRKPCPAAFGQVFEINSTVQATKNGQICPVTSRDAPDCSDACSIHEVGVIQDGQVILNDIGNAGTDCLLSSIRGRATARKSIRQQWECDEEGITSITSESADARASRLFSHRWERGAKAFKTLVDYGQVNAPFNTARIEGGWIVAANSFDPKQLVLSGQVTWLGDNSLTRPLTVLPCDTIGILGQCRSIFITKVEEDSVVAYQTRVGQNQFLHFIAYRGRGQELWHHTLSFPDLAAPNTSNSSLDVKFRYDQFGTFAGELFVVITHANNLVLVRVGASGVSSQLFSTLPNTEIGTGIRDLLVGKAGVHLLWTVHTGVNLYHFYERLDHRLESHIGPLSIRQEATGPLEYLSAIKETEKGSLVFDASRQEEYVLFELSTTASKK